ncbi:MAG: carboxylesterase/lipase family protein [Pseudomonadales bacterium]
MPPVIRLGCLGGLLLLAAACGQEAAQVPGEGTGEQTMSPARPAGAPIATTLAGPVQGAATDGVLVFKGIRYGADTASTRFTAPEAPQPWTETADATAFGASCIQTPYPPDTAGGLFESWTPDPVPPTSEDCLFLNVWTPALADGGKRPVMVWLHGGGLTRGSGSSNAYDGTRLVRRGDVVVVTLNHRLNVFGYTYLADFAPGFADSGNAGILDLLLALEWVQGNAEAFGGDPGNVTIFGESGGGWKVTTLMAMKAAQGLFHRAAVQSGPLLEFEDKARASAAGAALARSLGLKPETAGKLKTMPAAALLNAFETLNATGVSVGNRPVLDGTHLDAQPFADARAAGIPMLIGTTRTETSLFLGAANPVAFGLTWEQLPSTLERSLNRPDVDVETVIATYRKLHPEYGPTDVLFTATTDAGFLNGSHTQADRKAALGGAPTYFYLLDWDTPVDGGKWRAPHALDIGMVFDNVARSASMSGTDSAAQQIADQMSEAWLAFARTGNPNHPGLPEWPAYDATTRSVLLFGLRPAVAADPHGAQRAVFLTR